MTLGILLRRYMQHVGAAKLSPEQRQILKHVVEAELIVMQVSLVCGASSWPLSPGRAPLCSVMNTCSRVQCSVMNTCSRVQCSVMNTCSRVQCSVMNTCSRVQCSVMNT